MIKPLALAGGLTAAVALSFAAFNSHATKTLQDDCWTPTFTEDFDSLSLWNPADNSGLWKTSYIWGSDIRINEELQYYVDPATHGINPFSIEDGILKITADRTPDGSSFTELPYTSGVLTTEKSFSQQYGRFDARLKVPAGKGLWSAFWLLPSFAQWPEGIAVLPEIDVMEYLGHEKNIYHTTLHTNQTGKLTSHTYQQKRQSDLSNNFHVYSVVWNQKSVSWYLDGEHVAEHATPADYTRPVHFLLNLAVGGSWPGSPDSRTRFPVTYDIDYVKAFKPDPKCS